MALLRILHLVGSPTSSFYCDLSQLYAQGCIEATADSERYDFIIAYVTPDCLWRFVRSLSDADINSAKAMPVAEAMQVLAEAKIDVAIPQMFCLAGMTDYRALLDILKIPYVGNSAMLMGLTADKARTKAIVAAAGVKVPAGELLRPGDQPTLAPPVIVKPNCSDNSCGVSLVTTPQAYSAALEKAFTYGNEVVVEQFIELGREVRCGLMAQGQALVGLPLEEYRLDSVHRPIRSERDKLNRGDDGQLTFSAKTSDQSWVVDAGDPDTERVWEIAKKCHQALGCKQYSLFDFRIDPSGQPWFIEAGLYCSFSPKSVLVNMSAATSVPVDAFFANALMQAMSDGGATHLQNFKVPMARAVMTLGTRSTNR